jgi:hypothetical protein
LSSSRRAGLASAVNTSSAAVVMLAMIGRQLPTCQP